MGDRYVGALLLEEQKGWLRLFSIIQCPGESNNLFVMLSFYLKIDWQTTLPSFHSLTYNIPVLPIVSKVFC